MIRAQMVTPCPWCGSTDVVAAYVDTYKWGAIRCQVCEGTGPSIRTGYRLEADFYEEALVEWNRRAE